MIATQCLNLLLTVFTQYVVVWCSIRKTVPTHNIPLRSTHSICWAPKSGKMTTKEWESTKTWKTAQLLIPMLNALETEILARLSYQVPKTPPMQSNKRSIFHRMAKSLRCRQELMPIIVVSTRPQPIKGFRWMPFLVQKTSHRTHLSPLQNFRPKPLNFMIWEQARMKSWVKLWFHDHLWAFVLSTLIVHRQPIQWFYCL